jgi:hypothetical protein
MTAPIWEDEPVSPTEPTYVARCPWCRRAFEADEVAQQEFTPAHPGRDVAGRRTWRCAGTGEPLEHGSFRGDVL